MLQPGEICLISLKANRLLDFASISWELSPGKSWGTSLVDRGQYGQQLGKQMKYGVYKRNR